MAVPLIVYGDVEQTALDYFREALADEGAAWGTRLPDPPVEVFVLIRRVGGLGPRPGVDLARIDYQVWHRSEVEAHDLAELVRAHWHRLRGVGLIRGVRESASPISIPDPDTKRPRYLGTVDLTVRGASL